MQRIRHTRVLLAAIVLSISWLLGGCTPDKAKAINIAAIQFRAEALAAIDAVAEMHAQELAPPVRSSAEATAQFVKDVEEWDTSSGQIGYEEAVWLLSPFDITIAPANQDTWRRFLGDLRIQYQEFAAIFQDLERGSFLATDAVKRSERHAESLVAQMAAFAAILDKYPPQLLQHRSAYIVDLRRAQRAAPSADKDRRIAELRERLVQLQSAERELQRATVAQCLKAATLGYKLRQLISDYESLSIDDVNFFVGKALAAAGEVTGRDYGGLQAKADTLLQDIKTDAVWRTVVEKGLLQRVENAVSKRLATN